IFYFSLLFFFFFFYFYFPLLYLHSFPTRRSSDLLDAVVLVEAALEPGRIRLERLDRVVDGHVDVLRRAGEDVLPEEALVGVNARSEEHTSELQSRFDLVCRLLLEKKKKKHTIKYH